MTQTELQAAVEQLAELFQGHPKWGTFRPCATVPNSLSLETKIDIPDSLREFYAIANPVSLEMPWTVETLCLYSVEDLESAQEGYRFEVGKHGTKEEGWAEHWVVIGDTRGDPFIVDARSSDAPVFAAVHGIGRWEPKRITNTFAEFIRLLAGWLHVRNENEGRIRGEDGTLSPQVVSAIETTAAAHLSPSCRRDFMTFVG